MEIITNQVKPIALEGLPSTKISSVESKLVEKPQQAETDKVTLKPQDENTTESLQNAVAQINEYMQKLERSLQFTIDEGSGKEVVTVLDKNTEEIIRQFPSEETLVIARQIAEHKDDVVNLFSSQA